MPETISREDRTRIIAWLKDLDLSDLSEGQHWASYQTWARNGVAWNRRLGAGGTCTLRAIKWYQHVHKPGSTDSRPGIIIPAILWFLALTEVPASEDPS